MSEHTRGPWTDASDIGMTGPTCPSFNEESPMFCGTDIGAIVKVRDIDQSRFHRAGDPGDGWYHSVIAVLPRREHGKTEANARLIAAAPDLLAALEALYREAKELNDACDHSVGICWCEYHRVLEQAAAALAKAGKP